MLPMLCGYAPADFMALRYPIAAEIKYDGIRCIAVVANGKTTLYSRTGKKLANFEDIKETCNKLDDAVYDGELVCNDGFEKLLQRANSEVGKNTDIKVEYKIFDKLTHDEWGLGHSARDYTSRCINAKIGERVIIKNPVDLEIYYNYVIKSGHEGLILKKLDGIYESNSKHHWYKLKPKDTLDLLVIGVEEGLGKYQNKLGAIQCQSEINGSPIYAWVGTGFTDEQREQLWKDKDALIGKTIEVEYQELTKRDKFGARSLRFPTFKCVRIDK